MLKRALMAITLMSVLTSWAADKSFAVADGSWGEADNWSPSGVPVLGDVVTVPNGKTCHVGTGVTTALVKTTIAAGGTLAVDGGSLTLSDNSSSKQSLSINGTFRLVSGSVAVHDFTIAATGKAELPGGSITVHNNLYNNAATTETTGLHIGQNVTLAKGYWNFNAPGGIIDGLHRTLEEIRVPTSTRTTGTLLITNSTLVAQQLGLAYHLSSRNDLTGRVDIVKSDVAVKSLKISDSHITGHNQRELFVGTDGTLSFTSSIGAEVDANSTFRLQVGGEGVENARLIVTNTSNQAKSVTLGVNSTLAICEGGTASLSKVYVKRSGELLVGGGNLPAPIECQTGGSVKINGGTVEGVVSCASEGRVVMNGGTLRNNLLVSDTADTAAEAYYCFDGGAQLYLQDVLVGGKTVNSHNVTETTITPTTMEFRDCNLKCYDTYCYLIVGAKSTTNKGRVIFDGCKMDPSNGTNYKWYLRAQGTDTAEIIIKGAENELYFQQLEGNDTRLEYVFDGGFSTLVLERTGHPDAVGPRGNLYLTITNGVTLLPNASYDIITSAAAMDLSQVNFKSTPWSRGDSPWSGALANGNKAYRITLNASVEAAPGSGVHALSVTKAAGAVAVPVGVTDKLEELIVKLEMADGSNREMTFPAAKVTPNATNYFVWDFADGEVASVRVSAREVPEKFYLHFQ